MLIEVFTLLWLHASMPNVAVKIQQNFESYCSFVEAAKTINPPAIPLTTITSHAFRKGTADVVCPNFGGKKYFEVVRPPAFGLIHKASLIAIRRMAGDFHSGKSSPRIFTSSIVMGWKSPLRLLFWNKRTKRTQLFPITRSVSHTFVRWAG
jgi:hypothetical protein